MTKREAFVAFRQGNGKCVEWTRQVCELGVVQDEATRLASTASWALTSLSQVIRTPSTS